MISGVDPTPPIWLGAGGAYWILILIKKVTSQIGELLTMWLWAVSPQENSIFPLTVLVYLKDQFLLHDRLLL